MLTHDDIANRTDKAHDEFRKRVARPLGHPTVRTTTGAYYDRITNEAFEAFLRGYSAAMNSYGD